MAVRQSQRQRLRDVVAERDQLMAMLLALLLRDYQGSTHVTTFELAQIEELDLTLMTMPVGDDGEDDDGDGDGDAPVQALKLQVMTSGGGTPVGTVQ
jgi:hypothetical protein